MSESETVFEQQHLIAALDTSLPAIGLALVVIVCLYVAMREYKEFTADTRMKSVMYEETGISGKYEYKLPDDEKVNYHQMKGYLVYLKKNGVPPQNGARLEITMEEAKNIVRKKMDDEERKKLKMALVKWMIGTIEVLAQVEKDRPGAAKLFDKNLVSEEYWDGVQQCFADVHETIQEISAEAEFIEDGWGPQVFQQGLQLWRITKIRETNKTPENEASK